MKEEEELNFLLLLLLFLFCIFKLLFFGLGITIITILDYYCWTLPSKPSLVSAPSNVVLQVILKSD